MSGQLGHLCEQPTPSVDPGPLQLRLQAVQGRPDVVAGVRGRVGSRGAQAAGGRALEVHLQLKTGTEGSETRGISLSLGGDRTADNPAKKDPLHVKYQLKNA